MKIAIDLDGTILNCDSFVFKLASLFAGRQKIRHDFSHAKISPEVRDIKPFHMFKFLDADEYYVIENSAKYINTWRKNGAEVCILSSRPNWRVLRALTQTSLKNIGLDDVSSLVIACNDKASYCLQNSVDILIDDSPSICKNASTLGINSLHYGKNSTYMQTRENDFLSWKDIDRVVSRAIEEDKEFESQI